MAGLSKPSHVQKGAQAEQLALQYLQQQGLRWRASNVRFAVGELDLVMQDGATVVIVEVRYRQSQRFGGALASVTPRKQARIIAADQHYVIIQGLTTAAIRFDVVALSGDNHIQWIQNAFLT
jgi:putative endonuclease